MLLYLASLLATSLDFTSSCYHNIFLFDSSHNLLSSIRLMMIKHRSRIAFPLLLAVKLLHQPQMLLVHLALLGMSVGMIPSAAAFVIVQPGSKKMSTKSLEGSLHRRRYRTSNISPLYMEVIEADVVIVGGGPAGCTCALYTSRANLKTVIVDKNPSVGALAITSHIANYPGVDRSMTGAELLDQMRTQAIQYGTDYRRAQVFMMEIDKDACGPTDYGKIVYTPDVTVKARSMVLATGAMGRAAPPFPGEEEYLGQGVSYCATCDGAFYQDSEVAVFGATSEAMEEAMFLTKFASTVHWITNINIAACLEKQNDSSMECNKIIDDEIMTDLLACDNVKHWSRTKFLKVEGDDMGVTGVQVQSLEGDKEVVTIPVEGAFIYGAGGGSKPITDFIQNQVELKEDGGVIVDDDMQTSIEGVFAIGDIRNTMFKQVVVAAADGCVAAMSIDKYLKGRTKIKVDWIHK